MSKVGGAMLSITWGHERPCNDKGVSCPALTGQVQSVHTHSPTKERSNQGKWKHLCGCAKGCIRPLPERFPTELMREPFLLCLSTTPSKIPPTIRDVHREFACEAAGVRAWSHTLVWLGLQKGVAVLYVNRKRSLDVLAVLTSHGMQAFHTYFHGNLTWPLMAVWLQTPAIWLPTLYSLCKWHSRCLYRLRACVCVCIQHMSLNVGSCTPTHTHKHRHTFEEYMTETLPETGRTEWEK